MIKLSVLVATIFFIACSNQKNEQPGNTSSSRDLQGEWNNLSLKVTIHSKNNSDSNEVFEVNRPQWEEILKIKPIRSFFNADSSWHSAHYNLKDSLVYDPSGRWWITGSKLTMLQLLPSPDTTTYDFSVVNDTATFECMLDWDMDGKKDDAYFGKQIRVKK